MTMIYHEHDHDLADLAGRRVGVVGYGNMGCPIALNLRDSGISVTVSEPTGEKRREAEAEGFATAGIRETAHSSDVLMLLLRDEDMPQIYLEEVAPMLRRGQTLIFSSSYNIAFGFIEPPGFVDYGLVAARTLGAAVRERYLSGEGFSSFVAVGQDGTGRAWPTTLAIAGAIGALRGGAIEIRFEQEAELDLFMQQAILPVLHQAVINAATLLLEKGYPAEAVFTELYLSGETADYLRQASLYGLNRVLRMNSLTAQYGTLTRYDRFNDLRLERMMERTLDEIRSGDFAREWAGEYAANYPRLRAQHKLRQSLPLWDLEQQTLDLLGRGGDEAE
jgi:ketol-acid reductoisomerase